MFAPPAAVDRVASLLAEADRATRAAVDELVRSRDDVVADSGLSWAVWLAGVSRLPRRERAGLLNAVDVLPSLPAVRARWQAGQVAWPVVTAVCGRAGRLSADEKTVLDARLGDAIDHLTADGNAGGAADAILAVLAEVCDQLRWQRDRDRERRLERGEFVALQPFLDGTGGSLYGELGAVSFATVADAIIDARPEPDLQPNPHGNPALARDNRQSIGQANAAGLVALCSRDGRGKTKQPKLIATVSMETLLGLQRTTGDLLTRLLGGRLHLTATAARQLADGGADLRLVVHDRHGATVGVGRQQRVAPGWLADAVRAFNATCTFPGCRVPARECDLDHAHDWADDGTTDAGNLHPVHRGHHTAKTDGHWTVRRHRDQSTTWTHVTTGLTVTQPSLWTIKALATGTHPAQQAQRADRRRQPS